MQVKNGVVYFTGALAVLVAVYLLASPLQSYASSTVQVANHGNCTSMHIHAKLKIAIEGEELQIPANIGITQGNVMDTDLSGMEMSPIHTHDASGVLHVENTCLEKKSEATTLGYFFQVWGKNFSSQCVLQYCNEGSRRVKLTINGVENFNFADYKLLDLDEIKITYGEPVVGKTAGLERVDKNGKNL